MKTEDGKTGFAVLRRCSGKHGLSLMRGSGTKTGIPVVRVLWNPAGKKKKTACRKTCRRCVKPAKRRNRYKGSWKEKQNGILYPAGVHRMPLLYHKVKNWQGSRNTAGPVFGEHSTVLLSPHSEHSFWLFSGPCAGEPHHDDHDSHDRSHATHHAHHHLS